MEAAPAQLSAAARYKLLTGLVVPRPIAWVSSRSADGTANLAPFSYFSIVGHDPLAISIAVTGRKPDGSAKDTGRNLLPPREGGRGEFVVNIVCEEQAAAMARTARPLPTGESEFDLAGLAMREARLVDAPRVAGAPAALECRTIAVLPVGTSRLVVAEVLHIFAEDHIVDERGRIDFARLGAIGRLAGAQYARISDRLTLADEGYFSAANAGRIAP